MMTGVTARVPGSPWRLGGHGRKGGAAGRGSPDGGLGPAGEAPQQMHGGAPADCQDSSPEPAGRYEGKQALCKGEPGNHLRFLDMIFPV